MLVHDALSEPYATGIWHKNTRAINMYFPAVKLGGLVPN